MGSVTLVEFRKNARGVLRRIQRGERLVLTVRGRPVARLEPISEGRPAEDDSIYRLADLATVPAGSLTNDDIDRTVYGQ